MTQTNPDQEQPVLYSVEDAVARITLNRPDKRNALNAAAIAGLKDRLREASQDERVRVVVISGAGKDFCSGADLAALQQIAQASVDENAEDARSLLDLFVLIRQIPFPVVAAVTGRALAGGAGLATSCDIVLAAKSARFGYPEVKIGFVAAMVMAILRRNVSEKRAFALLTRGAEISAEQALEFGLVNEIYADESFEDDVARYVNDFKKLSRSAVSLTKTLLYQMDGLSFSAALETGADVNVIARLTKDCQERVAKFLGK
ncbi:MAG TPA: enoyl-CoA hydratase/isomerase family protein [Pyrinomonadaceae bacterium]|nr:enoyl-CoA hydratase/isomerase family protein [Pyrinomonadaceae bacterium]